MAITYDIAINACKKAGITTTKAYPYLGYINKVTPSREFVFEHNDITYRVKALEQNVNGSACAKTVHHIYNLDACPEEKGLLILEGTAYFDYIAWYRSHPFFPNVLVMDMVDFKYYLSML